MSTESVSSEQGLSSEHAKGARFARVLRLFSRTAVLASSLSAGMFFTSHSSAQGTTETPAEIEWTKPNDIDSVLTSVIAINWTERDLRAGLDVLQSTFCVPIVGDRRIDPHLRVNASIDDVPLETAVNDAVKEAGFEALAGPWGILVAPPTVADRTLTTAALLRGVLETLPAGERRKLTRTTAASWPRLTQPRELLRAIASEYDVQISGLENVPHDVWPEQQLPELDLIDRVTLVLSSFDLTVRWIEAGRSLEIVPLPERVRLTQTYTIPSNRRSQSSELPGLFPGETVTVTGARVEVDGMWHVHRGVQAWLAGASAGRPRTGRTGSGGGNLLTLNAASAELGDVVALLEERLELTFEWSDAAAEKRNERVPLMVQDVTLEELLDKITTAAGLSYEQDGKTIRLDVKE